MIISYQFRLAAQRGAEGQGETRAGADRLA